MALTRKLCKGLGLSDEQTEGIIEAHTETTDALKATIAELQTKADAAEGIQKELDALKNGKDYKAEYDKLKADFDAYKADIDGKETLGKVKTAYRKLLTEKKIDPDVLDTVMDATRFDDMKLTESGELENAEDLGKNIDSRWGKFVVTEGRRGSGAETPPGGGGKPAMTKEQIMGIKDTTARQAAIAENHELFGF